MAMKRNIFSMNFAILLHCCERDIFQEGQFWLYPVLIPIHDGGTRVIKLIRLGYVLWNWASTLQIFCLIHNWTFHRLLINLEKRGWMLFTTIVVIFWIGQKSPAESHLSFNTNYYKMPLQAPLWNISSFNQLRLKWGLLFHLELGRNHRLPFITPSSIPYYVCIRCSLPIF